MNLEQEAEKLVRDLEKFGNKLYKKRMFKDAHQFAKLVRFLLPLKTKLKEDKK